MKTLRSATFLFAAGLLAGSAAHAATLSATPNPCLTKPGQVLCTTQLSWESGTDNAQIYVTVLQTGQTSLVANASSGAISVPWIYIGNTYRFDMWSIRGSGFGQSRTRLGTVTVSGRADVPY